MAFSTYAGLKTAIADWLNRDDLTATIPDFVTLATSTLNKVLRDRRMITVSTVSSALRYITLPTDVLEVLQLSLDSTGVPLEVREVSAIGDLRRTRFLTTGTPRYFAIVGPRGEIVPTPTGSTTYEISYYAEIPALSADGDTNWLLTDDPDVYLYTALLHAAVYLHDPAMTATIKPLLDQRIAASVVVEEKAA